MRQLTVRFVEYAKPGTYCDGNGHYLVVGDTGWRSWMLRVQVRRLRREIGPGAVQLRNFAGDRIGNELPVEEKKQLTLAEAREMAAWLRNVAKAGRDPIEERRKAQY